MIESSPSRTALATSLMRALHSRRDPSPLLDDPWGDRLVPESERDRFCQRILARMDSEARAAALRSPGSVLDDFFLTNVAYPGVVIRSRYTEDALKEAANRGTRQYVLIGAGFDSFALRLFEVRTKAHIACATLLRRSLNLSCSVVRLIEASRQFGQAETNDMQLNPNLTCAISKGSRQ